MAGLVLLIGKRGTGKSRLARAVSLEAARNGGLVLVDDSVLDWRRWGVSHPNIIMTSGIDPNELARRALEAAPCTLVYDELDRALPLHKTLSPALADVVRRGRHYRVTLVGCTQRPALVSTEIRALVTCAAIFRVSSSRDRGWIRDNIVDDIPLDTITKLPDNQFYLYK